MKIVVGLGNPEERYSNTRHNLGFDILDELARKFNLVEWVKEEKFKAELIKTPDLILVKPQTFMNNSGLSVKLLTTYYKLPAADLIVIHDELDLPLGKIKVRMGGAAAGHHGVESIINTLKDEQFIRIRLGIGGEHVSAEKFVLEPFIQSEKSTVKHMIKAALKALEILLKDGLEQAQNQFN